MDYAELLSKVDHTLLKPEADWAQIRDVVEDGIAYQTASVCIPPAFVAQASAFAEGRVPICTVIGFPNGYMTMPVKCFEAKDAIQNGADELDMVINIGWVKEECWTDLLDEIRAVKALCGERVLKVIIETCLLHREEKIKLCELVSASGADFIKTSTGFSNGGATREDIALFAKHVAPGVKIKAAGGIRCLKDAEDFLALGACRLGTSAIVKQIKEERIYEPVSNAAY